MYYAASYIVILSVCFATFANAQTISLPEAADAGRFRDRYTESPEPLSKPKISTPPASSITLPQDDSTQILSLNQLIINGSTVYSVAELQALYQDKLSKPLTINELKQIAADITTHYRNDDYFLSYAYVAEAPLNEALAKEAIIYVVESSISSVIFEGYISDEFSSILEEIRTELINYKPIKQEHLESALLRLNDLHGITAESLLKPTDQPGEIALYIKLYMKKLDASASLDNRGSEFVGPWQYTATVDVNDTLLDYDRLSLRGYSALQIDELKGFEAAYSVPFTSRTSLSLNGFMIDSEPGEFLRDFDIASSSERLGLELTHQWLRQRSENLSSRLEFGIRNVETTSIAGILSEDRIRFLNLATSYDIADEIGGINIVDLQLRQGLNVFGATETGSVNLSRQNGHSDFTKIQAYLSRMQLLDNGFSAFAALRGQYAFDPLLVSEEFGIGGSQFGRAFDPSAITGDHGFATLAELRYDIFHEGSIAEYLRKTQFYLGYDYGMVWRINPVNLDNRQSAASLSIGTRLNIAQNIFLTLEAAQPTIGGVPNSRDENDKHPRYYLGLSIAY